MIVEFTALSLLMYCLVLGNIYVYQCFINVKSTDLLKIRALR